MMVVGAALSYFTPWTYDVYLGFYSPTYCRVSFPFCTPHTFTFEAIGFLFKSYNYAFLIYFYIFFI